MNGQQLAAALRSGQRVYGTAIISTSPHWLKVVKNLPVDFVFIDTEHIPIERQTLSWMCRAYEGIGVAPVVRIPSPDPYQACMALDGGAHGLVAPYIESAGEVQALRGAVKWRPLKGRKLMDILAGRTEPEAEMARYLADWNANSVLIVNIESQVAIDALDEILAVPQLDAVLIGPHDLSINLGLPEQYDHPRFDAAVRTIIAKAREAGVGAGIHFSTSLDAEIEWAKAGANLMIHSSDITTFSQVMAADLTRMRTALGESGITAAADRVGV